MIVDLDRAFPDTENSPEDRVFPYDIFVSHRRHDLPLDLIDRLSHAGVKVIWDHDLDLRDRRVAHAVSRAMRSSRFVALYVSDGYEDSEWCRAEYLAAARIQNTRKVERALVLCQSRHAVTRIPGALESVQRFLLDDASEARLAAFLISNNATGDAGALALRAKRSGLSADLSLLPPREQLNILEQRADFWRHRGAAEISVSDKAKAAIAIARAAMHAPISEGEIILREVYSIVMKPRADCQIGPHELHQVVAIAKHILEAVQDSTMESDVEGLHQWLYDFALIPLLLAVEEVQTRDAATGVYVRLCAALQKSSFAREVPIYLSVLDLVAHGTSPSEAVNQAKVAFLRASAPA